jgi:hypothetical protein
LGIESTLVQESLVHSCLPGCLAAWLPDLVRLGELERHLGDGVIEAIVDAAIAKGRLRERERRRIMSYPLVVRLMIAMALTPDVILSFLPDRGCDLRPRIVDMSMRNALGTRHGTRSSSDKGTCAGHVGDIASGAS